MLTFNISKKFSLYDLSHHAGENADQCTLIIPYTCENRSLMVPLH